MNFEFKISEIREFFLDLIKNDFPDINLNHSVQNWDKLTWTEFESELQNQGVNASVIKSRNWQFVFNTLKEQVQFLEHKKITSKSNRVSLLSFFDIL